MEILPSCLESGCSLPKLKPYHRCAAHWEAVQPPDERAKLAAARRDNFTGTRKRGDKTCAGCGWAVPEFYKTGARCKSCAILDRRTSNWGLSAEDQRRLYEMSDGKCMICGSRQQKVALSIDHNHDTGEIRGVLCGRGGTSCNEMIGWWFNNPRRFLATAVYLLSPPARKVLDPDRALSDTEIIDIVKEMVRDILKET